MVSVLLVLTVGACMQVGCSMVSPRATVDSGVAAVSEEALVPPVGLPLEPLIKPVIQDEAPPPGRSEENASSSPNPDPLWKAEATFGQGNPATHAQSDPVRVEDGAPRNTGPGQWEDRRVEAAAMELALKTPGVIKLKICYDLNQDEWWVVLFEDHGPIVEIRPFVWNRDSASFEPFLVVRQIAKDRLQVQLSEDEPSRPCRVVDLPLR